MDFNIFEILELDINEKDTSKIKSILSKKQAVWHMWKNQGTPKNQILAKKYLSHLKEIQNTINDSTLLEKHRIELLEKQKKILEELDNLISFLDSKTISDEEFKVIKNKFKKLEEKVIKDRLNKLGIRIEQKATKKPTKKKKIKKIESTTMEEINRSLDILGKKDLYDFLELSSNVSIKALQNKAEELYNQNKKSTKLKESIISKLAGHAKNIFKSNESKESYDYTLSTLNLKKLDDHIELAAADQVITIEEMEKLLSLASKYNIQKEIALEYIEEKAKKRKWVVAKKIVDIKINKCVFCGEIIKENEKKCAWCGEEVKQSCPICKNTIFITDKFCKSCGLAIGDIPYMRNKLKAIDLLDIQKAKQELEDILKIWPKWQEAKNKLNKINTQISKKATLYKDVESLINKRLYSLADKKLKEYKQLYINTNTNKLEIQIEKAFNEIKPFFDKAERAYIDKNWKEATKYYKMVLSKIQDYQPAKKKLSKIPIEFEKIDFNYINNKSVKLLWQLKSNENISFLILRKKDSSPNNNKDGEELTRTHNNSFIDKIDIGGDYYYGVFPIRDNVVLEQGKIIGNIFIPSEIKEAKIDIEDKKIKLSWTFPKKAVSVDIFRKLGNKKFRKEDGEKIATNYTKNYYEDKNIKNNLNYTYLIIANYKNSISSDGKYLIGKIDYQVDKNMQLSIKYRVKEKKRFIFFGRTKEKFVELSIDVKDSKFELNDVIVVCQNGRVPLNKNDGTKIKSMKRISFKNTKARIKINQDYWNKDCYVKLFFKQEEFYETIRLIPDKESNLKI